MIEVLRNKKGKWFWHVVAKNGRILAHSEDYCRKQRAIDGAKALLKALHKPVLKINPVK